MHLVRTRQCVTCSPPATVNIFGVLLLFTCLVMVLLYFLSTGNCFTIPVVVKLNSMLLAYPIFHGPGEAGGQLEHDGLAVVRQGRPVLHALGGHLLLPHLGQVAQVEPVGVAPPGAPAPGAVLGAPPPPLGAFLLQLLRLLPLGLGRRLGELHLEVRPACIRTESLGRSAKAASGVQSLLQLRPPVQVVSHSQKSVFEVHTQIFIFLPISRKVLHDACVGIINNLEHHTQGDKKNNQHIRHKKQYTQYRVDGAQLVQVEVAQDAQQQRQQALGEVLEPGHRVPERHVEGDCIARTDGAQNKAQGEHGLVGAEDGVGELGQPLGHAQELEGLEERQQHGQREEVPRQPVHQHRHPQWHKRIVVQLVVV
mmetsp:Transcript_14399/g.24082  ORF Transcript_14399/g.24082 Transcript_14399/m.24082 type:complete len:367 (-) Transcript_14399:179-1279(-)